MDFLDGLLKMIAVEKKQLGGIIDDRSAGGIPVWSYVREYNKLEEVYKFIESVKWDK